ncbi:hypothetical protein FGD71_018995 [Streptomyces sporangiiformans]|uniref:GNAT family N-acetyltransferase n=1 Tax=Streptomyces sporangiiformans TaxID=2315329 RepID=A0A505DLT1_9ACTN|nr:hypothetical protein FGD71_018995 [Streptomyces sporangiiformans]
MLIAEDTAFAGCAFGFPVRREGTWWRGFDGTLPQSIEQLTVSGHVFAITEIVVHPHAQNQDLARRLQQRLLADQHASLGATLVDQADSASLAAFLFWGWQDIGEVRRPSGPAVLRALVLPLGPRTAARPDGLGHDNRTQRHD